MCSRVLEEAGGRLCQPAAPQLPAQVCLGASPHVAQALPALRAFQCSEAPDHAMPSLPLNAESIPHNGSMQYHLDSVIMSPAEASETNAVWCGLCVLAGSLPVRLLLYLTRHLPWAVRSNRGSDTDQPSATSSHTAPLLSTRLAGQPGQPRQNRPHASPICDAGVLKEAPPRYGLAAVAAVFEYARMSCPRLGRPPREQPQWTR